MPVSSEEHKHGAFVPDHELLRQLRCSKGTVEVAVEFCPRADYGCRSIAIRSIGALGLRMDVGRGAYWLRSTVPLRVNSDSALATFCLREGEVAQFSLSYAEESPTVLPALGKVAHEAVKRSVRWWQQWAHRSRYEGPYREVVTLEPPGFLALHYGAQTPLVIIVSHAIFGVILGAFYHVK